MTLAFPKPAYRLREAKPLKRRKTTWWKRAAAKAESTLEPWQLVAMDEDQSDGSGVARCAYCTTEKATTVDHIVPIARGGKDEASNVALCCWPCNARKGTQTWVPKLRHRFLPKED